MTKPRFAAPSAHHACALRPRIDNWAAVENESCPFQAPELRPIKLTGWVSNHPIHKDDLVEGGRRTGDNDGDAGEGVGGDGRVAASALAEVWDSCVHFHLRPLGLGRSSCEKLGSKKTHSFPDHVR